MSTPKRATAISALLLAASLLTACSGTSQPSLMSLPPTTTAPASDGLVTAMHTQCNIGQKVLRYLASGDNQGDPRLDTLLSASVGVPLPQARSIADQQIQTCDAKLSQQEAAAASSEAKASEAAAEAAASAQAAQDKATRQASEQKVCAAIGGHMKDGGNFADLCVPNNSGRATDGSGDSCGYATIPFQPDGTLAASDIASFKSGYPGCFP